MLTTSVSLDGLWTLNLPSVTAGTIAFDLKAADARVGKKVMAWAGNAPPAGVRFAKAAGGHHVVEVQSDGVYVISGGIMVIVR